MKTKIVLVLLATMTTLFAQDYTLNTSKSLIKWTGEELTTKQHYGSLEFESGTIAFKDGVPVSGSFVVDMTTIVNQDLPAEYAKNLEGHLKSDDFFSVAKFPSAKLIITGATAAAKGAFKVDGQLIIKGISHPVRFDLIPDNGNWIANLIFDRSKYEVRFRSGTFFQNLGDKLILDDIVLETKLVFTE